MIHRLRTLIQTTFWFLKNYRHFFRKKNPLLGNNYSIISLNLKTNLAVFLIYPQCGGFVTQFV